MQWIINIQDGVTLDSEITAKIKADKVIKFYGFVSGLATNIEPTEFMKSWEHLKDAIEAALVSVIKYFLFCYWGLVLQVDDCF